MRASLLALLVAATAAAGLAAVAGVTLFRGRPPGPLTARVLLALAVASALLVGLVLFGPAADDSGTGFAVAVTLVPVGATLLPALALRLHRRTGVVATWLVAVLMFGFALLFGLGFGMLYLPTVLLLFVAAVVLSAPPERAAGREGPPSGVR